MGENVERRESRRDTEQAKAIYLMGVRRPQINYRTGPNIWPDGPEVLLSAIQRNVICSREFI